MRKIAGWIADVLNNIENEAVIQRVRGEVEALTGIFTLYTNLRNAAG